MGILLSNCIMSIGCNCVKITYQIPDESEVTGVFVS